MPTYKVVPYKHGNYAVYEIPENNDDDEFWMSKQADFTGSLADCEAYIRLKLNQDVEF